MGTVSLVLAISVCICAATFEDAMGNPDEVVPQGTKQQDSDLISTTEQGATKTKHKKHSSEEHHAISKRIKSAAAQVKKSNAKQNAATDNIVRAVDNMAGKVQKVVHKARKHEREAIRKAKESKGGRFKGKARGHALSKISKVADQAKKTVKGL